MFSLYKALIQGRVLLVLYIIPAPPHHPPVLAGVLRVELHCENPHILRYHRLDLASITRTDLHEALWHAYNEIPVHLKQLENSLLLPVHLR